MASKTEIKTFHQTTYPAVSPDRPELSTRGKNALITGGGSGIGATIAQSFAKSGITNLALLGRTEKTLLENKAKIEALSLETKVWTYTVDVVDPKALNAIVQTYATSINGKIDILIANAGYLADLGSIISSDADDWWKGFEISVKGNFNLLRAFQPHAAPHATVINISSSVVHLPYMEHYSSYRSSKTGAYKLFEYYYNENPDFTVLQIHPGLIGGTAMSAKFHDNVTSLGYEYDDPALAGDFTVWAASDEAKFLNGRFVWATWDVNELISIKSELEADKTRFTLQLST
ncbi:Fc.00g047080.m01.CDS01 [Cosmosporella sp. VM-42]